MAKTFRDKGGTPRFQAASEDFRCRHCRILVGPTISGGRNRNHCPQCLYSRHVDGKTPGDRASDCGGSMAPVAAFQRDKGEHVIVHKCLSCGLERHNRIAADDDFDAVLALPVIEPRTSPNARSADEARDIVT